MPLAALRERLPGLVGERVVGIGDGWDSEVHVVDATWVVRVPRRPEVAAEVRAEIALLRELGPTLPVAVPHVEAVGPPEEGRFAYRLLHRFPVDRAAELGVPRPDWEEAVEGRLDEFSSRVAPLLARDERAPAARRFAELEVLYGVDFGLPQYVESGLAGVRERLR